MSLLEDHPVEGTLPAQLVSVDVDAAEAAPLPLLSLVVPVYNEALILMRSLTELYAYLQGLGDRYRFELLVVDDGSEDETAAIAQAFAATRAEVRLLRQPHNFGVGQALRFGFGRSSGDYVIAFDSDLSYSTDHIERLVEALRTEKARVAIASPYMKGGETTAIPWRREVMSKGINLALSHATRYDVHTVTGMVRAYDGLFLRSLNLRSTGPEINTEILYKAQIMSARVVEIPAHLDWSDQEERSRVRKVSLRVSTTSKLLTFATFLFRPLIWFVVPGIVLLVIAIGTLGSVAVTVGRQYFEASGSIDSRLYQAFAAAWEIRPQSFIVGGFSFVVAVLLTVGGLISVQLKRYFEELFHFNTAMMRRQLQLESTVAEAQLKPAATASSTGLEPSDKNP